MQADYAIKEREVSLARTWGTVNPSLGVTQEGLMPKERLLK
jgi:hypothetical protein